MRISCRFLVRNVGIALSLFGLLFCCPTAGAGPVTVFSGGSSGPYLTPETISQAPASFGAFGNGFIIPDFNHGLGNGNVWGVPPVGGSPTAIVNNGSDFVARGGVFLPSNWGANAGNFLEVGITTTASTAPLFIVSPSGSGYSTHQFTTLTVDGGQPQVVPTGFGSYGGQVANADGFGSIQLIDPSGHLTTLTSSSSLPSLPAGLAFAPNGFGALGGKLFVDGLGSDQIATVDALGNVSPFVTLPLKTGQPSPFEMAFSPEGFFPGEGSLLFVSIRGSLGGGGTLGDVLAYNSSGTLVASLRTDLGLTTFDPRGLLFIPDPSDPSRMSLLVSDASDPQILLLTPQAFSVSPEPASICLLGIGLFSMAGYTLLRRRKLAVAA